MKTILFALASIAFASCASFDVERFKGPITDDGWAGKGVLAYEPQPFILVSEAENNGTTTTSASLIWLPNPKRPMRISWNAGWLADVNPEFSLTDGWMFAGSAAEVGSDGGAFASSIGDILSGVSDIVGLFPKQNGEAKPGLYPLEYLEDGKWTLGHAVFFFKQSEKEETSEEEVPSRNSGGE